MKSLVSAPNVVYSSPIGTLSSELVKDQDHEISKAKISAVFDLLKEWNIEKFKALGFEQKAHDYAMDLLAKLQGISMLANVYNDREFLHRATRDVQSWINQITANETGINAFIVTIADFIGFIIWIGVMIILFNKQLKALQ